MFSSLSYGCLLTAMLGAQSVAAATWQSHNRAARRDDSTGSLESVAGGPLDLRIMGLGASITFGLKSSDGNGYRGHLRDLVVSEGGVDTSRVDMVGSVKAGDMADNEVEGYSGFRIDEVQKKANTAVPKYKPNLVLINAGTNDAAQNFDIDTAEDRMRELVEFVLDNMSDGAVLLSTLLINKNSNTESRVLVLNEIYRNIATEMEKNGKPVILVEMHDIDGLGLDTLVDGIHPNDEGYAVMAEQWWQSIQAAVSKGYILPTSTDQLTGSEPTDDASLAPSTETETQTAATTTKSSAAADTTTTTTAATTTNFTTSAPTSTNTPDSEDASPVDASPESSGPRRHHSPIGHVLKALKGMY